jgi:hypothetical protein
LHKLKFFVSKRNLQNPAPPRILMHFLSRIGVFRISLTFDSTSFRRASHPQVHLVHKLRSEAQYEASKIKG